MMTTTSTLVDDLIAGELSLADAAEWVASRDWAETPEETESDLDVAEAGDNEWRVIGDDPRLTAAQYAALVEARFPRDLVAKFDPGQERWPGGTPGGLGGQWKDDGIPDVDLPSAPTGKAVKPAIIYKKHKNGVVVAQRGSRRLRWDAESKKFAADELEDGSWVEKQQLTKTAAYNEMKDGDWREPGKATTPAKSVPAPALEPEGEPEVAPEPEPASSQTPEPDIPVVDTTAETEPETPETSSNNEGYEGPRLEIPEDIDPADLAEFHDLVRRDTLSGIGVANEPKLTYEETSRLFDLRDIFKNHPPAVAARIAQEAQIDAALEVWMRDNDIEGPPTAKFKRDLARQVREAFADKKIAVRVTPKNLENILEDGRIKSQFESGKSKGNNDPIYRSQVEATWFGIAHDVPPNQAVFVEPEKRPIYGYVAVDGIRPAGVGSGDVLAPSTDALSQYGQIQIVLKDDVRKRTTAMFGDSLNNRHQGLPSPVNQPSWTSFTPAWKSMVTRGLTGATRDTDSVDFRHGNYAEAQIHGGVSLSDIAEVVLPSTPPAGLRKQLDDAGVPWRVLNFKTAAEGSDEERANALRIAEQDVVAMDSEIARLDEMIAGYKAKGDTYSTNNLTKDVNKLKTQRKRIADALPALRKVIE